MKITILFLAAVPILVFGSIVASGATAQQFSNPASYPASSNHLSPEVYASPTVYSTPAVTNAQYSGTRSLPSQTYATQTYASESYPISSGGVSQTYASSFPVVSPQPIVNFQPDYYPATYSAASQSASSGLAQQKATRAAQMRLRGHVGGGLGGARFEGVGWSNQSRQRAIESCCYWGTRPTAQIGCVRGADGFWYACVLYN